MEHGPPPFDVSDVVECRSCSGDHLTTFLSLGTTPLGDALLTSPEQWRPEFPLDVGFCQDCTLVQLVKTLPAAAIFDADYPYRSSYSDDLARHSGEHCTALMDEGLLGPSRFLVEVASNDGYLLRRAMATGTRVLGIEPSPIPARAAVEAGIPTLQRFLGPQVAERVREEHGPADVVIANNVMAHVPDLNGFVSGLVTLLADDGVLRVENPGVRWLIEHLEFDTIYHEHYYYFSSTAVDVLMRRHGLVLNDIEFFPDLQGGTLRWSCSRSPGVSARAREQLEAEAALGLTTVEPYLAFGDRVERLQQDLRALLSALRSSGASIAAYGAATKGATLLNTTGIDHRTLDFVVDRNPHKQGKWMPGARLPVLSPEALLERQPDYVLLLAWNYAAEVRRQQAEYEARGGRFIVPVPSPTVL